MNHIGASVAVGFFTGLVTAFIGVILMAFGVDGGSLDQIGVFVRNVAALVGIVAGFYYYFTGRKVV